LPNAARAGRVLLQLKIFLPDRRLPFLGLGGKQIARRLEWPLLAKADIRQNPVVR
jgi:hypothetical protein